jgi:hypothetical protein
LGRDLERREYIVKNDSGKIRKGEAGEKLALKVV